jgi:tight adherence protein B
VKEVLIALAAVAAVALFEGLVHTARFFSEKKQDELRRRLQSLGGAESASLTLLRQGKLSGNPMLDSLLRGIPVAERLELLIEQAQVNLTVARLMGYSVAAAVAGMMGGLVVAGVALGMLFAAAGLAAPCLIIYGIRERRSLKLTEQLPDALDMMARSLRAGHALTSSFKLVAAEMPPPVCLEFGHAFEEQNLGMPFDRAIVQMTRRAPSNRDLKIFAVSVIIQKETGGNLVEIIEKIAETIRARYRFYGKLRTLTAEGRLSGIMIGIMPFVAGGLAAMLNPSYMRSLVVQPMGRMILLYAIVSWILGIFWLRRMARVDF